VAAVPAGPLRSQPHVVLGARKNWSRGTRLRRAAGRPGRAPTATPPRLSA